MRMEMSASAWTMWLRVTEEFRVWPTSAHMAIL